MDEKEKWEKHFQRMQRREELYNEQLEAYVALANTLKCKVCGEMGQVVALLGGRTVVLCAEHVNAWREFLTSHELMGEHNDAQADLYVAIHQCSEETAKERNRIWQDVIDAIYDLSGKWLEEEKMKWQKFVALLALTTPQ